ncbi:MAG: beta-lactamase family protein [Lachnospiraceae bacterium]|nr:beta-lactamase family protein [Lachnospiraceae bacterium]
MKTNDLSVKLNAIMQKWNFSGCISICKDNEVIYQGCHGYADYEAGKANDLETRFLIASVTKQFTAACIMMLVEEGKINLQHTLDDYLPEYTYASQITIRQMLNMMSGIPDMINEVIVEEIELDKTERTHEEQLIFEYQTQSRRFSLSEVLELVNNRELNFEPGTLMNYSNTNYSFLGFIVERLAGQSLGTFMEERIFKPLHMNETICNPSLATSIGYARLDDKIVRLGYGKDMSGDGCIVTTATDLSLWLNAVLTKNAILSKQSWEQILTMVPNPDKNNWLENYGFGWDKTGPWYQHNGGDMGYVTFVFMCIEKMITVAICQNLEALPLDDPVGRVEFEMMQCIEETI